MKVQAEADGFAGESAAYFGISELVEFAQAIATFPLADGDKRLSIWGGFWSAEQRSETKQEHLGISVYFADAHRGYIGVQVRMATRVWSHTRPNSQMKAIVEIVTTCEPLAKFGRDLRMLVQGKAKEAVLAGERIT